MARKPDNHPSDEVAEPAVTEDVTDVVTEDDQPSGNEQEPSNSETEMADTNKDELPPEGAFVEEAQEAPVFARNRPAPAFADEHVGVGGRYRVDPETGVRQVVYEKYTDNDGITRYRKAV